MPSDDWLKYIEDVLSFVKFKFDHNEIRWELYEHMEDMYDDLIQNGMGEIEASEYVIKCMGDAFEVGNELNKVHNPIVGWIWRITRSIAVILVIINIFPIATGILTTGYSLIQPYHNKEKLNLIYKVEVNEFQKIDDNYIFIDELRYYDDKSMEIRYGVFQNPFSDSVSWSFGLDGSQFYDEKGNEYHMGSGSSSAGYYRKSQLYIGDFPFDAEEFVIEYNFADRYFKFAIPLNEAKEEFN